MAGLEERKIEKYWRACSQQQHRFAPFAVDIFGNQGSLYMPMGMKIPENNSSLQIHSIGGNAQLLSLEVHKLKSAWV